MEWTKTERERQKPLRSENSDRSTELLRILTPKKEESLPLHVKAWLHQLNSAVAKEIGSKYRAIFCHVEAKGAAAPGPGKAAGTPYIRPDMRLQFSEAPWRSWAC